MIISGKKLVTMARKWQKLAGLGRKKRICFPIIEDKDAAGISKGHFAVYSEDEKRFMIPLRYLKQGAVFRELLKMSEEEFGAARDGPIRVPCDGLLIDYIIMIQKKNGISREFEQALLMSIASTTTPA